MLEEKPGIAIEIDELTKQFTNGTVLAIDKICTQISKGCVTGLVGPDGAGKTTLIRLMTGLMRPTTGTIKVLGIDTCNQDDLICQNLGYMPQKFGLYEDLTVIENLQLYARLKSLSRDETELAFARMLDFTQLKPFIKRLAGQLSGGMKQKLGLACALLSQPQVVLLDEPSVGVDPISRRELWTMVQDLAKQNIAIIWATSYLDEAQRCAKVLLLNEGKLLFDGPPEDLTQRVSERVFLVKSKEQSPRTRLIDILMQKGVLDATVQGENIRVLLAPNKAHLGKVTLVPTTPRFEDAFVDILQGNFTRESILAKQMMPKENSEFNPIEARNLTKHFGHFIAANNISFTIKRGEIFGLLGPNGAGKSTTFKMLCGLLQPTTGAALVSGLDLKTASAQARNKIGYMAQKFSLYSDLSVKQNLDFFAGVYGLSKQQKNEKMGSMIEIFELKKYLNTNAGALPLGYKQRLALACAIMHEPDVLFLDEPTSGVDPLTRREFWTHINAMVIKGVTIMVTTHFMDEAEYCDRVALIYRGENIATGEPALLKSLVKSNELLDPTLEDAFVELIKLSETKSENVKVGMV